MMGGNMECLVKPGVLMPGGKVKMTDWLKLVRQVRTTDKAKVVS